MIVIILAGGLGKRMHSSLPKVLHIINNKPMIYYAIRNAISIGATKILIVVGKHKDIIKSKIDEYFQTPATMLLNVSGSLQNNSKIVYIDQPEPLGTGHAIKCCMDYLITSQIPADMNILILSGDVPLIKMSTIESLLLKPNSILITETDTPKGCGRIIFNPDLTIKKIIEEKDCSDFERHIQFINCGVYNVTMYTLLNTIPHIKNNNKSAEYYLTDFVEIAQVDNIKLNHYILPTVQQYQISNINTMDDLVRANELLLISSLSM